MGATTALAIAGVAAAGASVAGSMMASDAAEEAAATSSDATVQAANLQLKGQREAIAFQKEMFDKQIELRKPWTQLGERTLGRLEGFASDLTTSPLYKIQQEEGERAINRSLAARGLWNSGTGITALSDFNRKLVAEETNRMWGRNLDLANLGSGFAAANASGAGQTGATLADIAMKSGNSLANITMQGGLSQAGYLNQAGQAQAGGMYGLGNTVLGGLNSYMYMKGFGATPVASAAPAGASAQPVALPDTWGLA